MNFLFSKIISTFPPPPPESWCNWRDTVEVTYTNLKTDLFLQDHLIFVTHPGISQHVLCLQFCKNSMKKSQNYPKIPYNISSKFSLQMIINILHTEMAVPLWLYIILLACIFYVDSHCKWFIAILHVEMTFLTHICIILIACVYLRKWFLGVVHNEMIFWFILLQISRWSRTERRGGGYK